MDTLMLWIKETLFVSYIHMMITNGHTYAENKRNTICLIYTHDDNKLTHLCCE